MDRGRFENIIQFVAQKHGFRLEVVEKDYYLTIVLNNIESFLSNRLVFKGGTLLNKIHLNYHRLSEDLDFVYYGTNELKTRSQRSKAIAPIRNKMEDFLKLLHLKGDNPEGEGFNNSTQYVFFIKYPSFVTGKDDTIKIEVGLRQFPIEPPVNNIIKHFYQDPFTGKDLIPTNKILSFSLREAVAEKLKAAITRKDVAIRDYYDLWHIAETNFDFRNKEFIMLLKHKLTNEGYNGDFTHNFGLTETKITLLHKQVETDLISVIRIGEEFDLNKVLHRFNDILLHKVFYNS